MFNAHQTPNLMARWITNGFFLLKKGMQKQSKTVCKWQLFINLHAKSAHWSHGRHALMKGSCDSRSPATEVLVSVKFLWDTVAVERSGFWERKKNRTRFSFTNKTTTVLTLKETATWQFSWAQGSTSRSPKLTPKKVIKLLLTSRNSRLHRHVCNWRGPLVVVTACHLVYQRHEHPQPQQGTQAVVGTIDLNGDVETHVSICKPTEIASCMCHLCFVDGCSLAPCGHRMCHIGHFICKRSNDQSSSPPQSQNITTKTMRSMSY